MSKRNLVPQAATPIPADILSVFGDPPLLSTEDPKIYSELLSRVTQAIKPKNVIEWMWVKDIVDLSWEIRRLRSFKTLLIEEERSSRIASIKSPPSFPLLMNFGPEPKDTESQKKSRILQLNSEEGSAIVFRATIQIYEKIDKLAASAELRRNVLLREIRFYREGLAHLMQEASDQIIDAEYKETTAAAE